MLASQASEAIGSHPSFIKVLGRVQGAPDGQLGLVFPLISHEEFSVLGGPPSFESVTRDTYQEGQVGCCRCCRLWFNRIPHCNVMWVWDKFVSLCYCDV